MKKMAIFVLAIASCIVSVFVAIYIQNTSYNIVLEGIDMRKAQNLVSENQICYIVERSIGATGARYTIIYGDYKGSEVELIGEKSPEKMLSPIFLTTDNQFLVYANEIGCNRNLKEFEMHSNCFILIVDKWYPIKPIKRNYGFRDYQLEYDFQSRWFYPCGYIDEFDVINEDYNNK